MSDRLARDLLNRYPGRAAERAKRGCGFWKTERNQWCCSFPTCWCYPDWIKYRKAGELVGRQFQDSYLGYDPLDVTAEILPYAYGEQPPEAYGERVMNETNPTNDSGKADKKEAWRRSATLLIVRPDGETLETELMNREHAVLVDYTNWKGERRWRPIVPRQLVWAINNDYHPEPQWLLEAEDLEDMTSGYAKFFALKNIHGWKPLLVGR